MGKKVKKKGKSSAKDKRVSNLASCKKVGESTDQTVESVDAGVSAVKERKFCSHLEQGTNLEKLLSKIGSSEPVKCESCREGAGGRRVTKGKGKQGKKKGGALGDFKSESKAIWVCLECGQYSCGGVGLPVTPNCHVVRHARQDRHHLVVHFEKPLLCWCFPCNMLIPVEKLEENSKGNDVLLEVVKLIKGRSSEASSVDAEDVQFGGGNESGLVAGASLTQDSFGRGGYVVRGMVNLGNTCFFNSIIQNFLAMDRIGDNLLQMNSVGPLTSAFKKLVTETYQQTGSKTIVNPRSLFGSVCSKAPQFRGFQQQDSHELLRCLLDGLSTEELAMRKQMSVSKEDTNVNTFADALFGGQISSTVQCCECGHSSTVYEPFLDLSLSVPTKKPATKKTQQVSRTKKSKLPPKKSGRLRPKVNKDLLPDDSLSSQSTNTKLVRHIHSDLPVNGEMKASCGDSRLLGSTNTANAVDEGVANLFIDNSDHTQIVKDTDEEKLASLSWMDYLQNEAVSEENDLTFHNGNRCLIEDVKKKGISSDELPSYQVGSTIPSTEEMVAFSGYSTSLHCAEKAGKQAFVSKNSVSSQEIEDTHIIPNTDEKTSAPFDSLLDYIEPPTVSEKSDLSVEKNFDSLVPVAESMGTNSEEVPGPGGIEYIGQNYLHNKDQIPDPSSSSLNIWEEEAPSHVQGSEVLLLPYKEESSIINYTTGKMDEASSSNIGWGQDEAEFEGIGDLFNEPEPVAGPSNRPSCSSEIIESGFLAEHSGESDPDEVDDTDSPVSVESCLNLFVKPELLSNENAWRCENCAKVLLRKKLEAKKLRKLTSTLMSSGTKTQGIGDLCNYENDVPAEAENIGFTHMKSNILEENFDSADGIVKCPDKNCVKLGKYPTVDLDAVDGKTEMRDSCTHDLQTSGLKEDCSKERYNNGTGASCSMQHADEKVSRFSLPLLHQGNSESESLEDEGVHCESVEVKRDATKSVLIHKAPSILTIHLKRFSQDARGCFSKLNGHVRFGETIDLRQYMDSRNLDDKKLHYRLAGVVEHLGSMKGGHYVAYVRGGRRSRRKAEKEVEECIWYHANDAYVREVSLDEVLNSEAYILFYEKMWS